jgi:hypothetical protein
MELKVCILTWLCISGSFHLVLVIVVCLFTVQASFTNHIPVQDSQIIPPKKKSSF